MSCIYLVHWNDAEWRDLAAPLRAEGHDVRGHFEPNRAPSWNGFEPQLVAISLDRLPAHGREVADWVWSAKKRRHVPVVFVGGKHEKVFETKNRFPDAIYCDTVELSGVIREIVEGVRPTSPAPEVRVKTAETAKRPSATPLAKKLGITSGSRYALLDAPGGFLKTLAPPGGAKRVKEIGDADVALCFVRSAQGLAERLGHMRQHMKPNASLWIAWPKRASGMATDLTDEVVRQSGLRAGLVDVKVCAVDETWSGLKFMIRVADRATEKRRKK